LSAETLLTGGAVADGREPAVCGSLAAGLARCIELLRSDTDLRSRVGTGPAWTRYSDGPWPTPHDSIFDFRVTPPGYGWLDTFAGAATTRLFTADRSGLEVVVGHADWCCGNLRFGGDQLVAAFDWDLVADVERVVVGLAAGGYPGGGSDVDTASPEDVPGVPDRLRRRPTAPVRPSVARTGTAVAAWVLAYNARCQLSLRVDHPGLAATIPGLGSKVVLLRERGDEYLQLSW